MERIKDTDGTIIYPSRSVAAKLHVGRNRMLKRLRNTGIFNDENHPVKADKKYFRAYTNHHGGFETIATYFTDEGIEYIKQFLVGLPIKKETIIREKPLSDDLIQLI